MRDLSTRSPSRRGPLALALSVAVGGIMLAGPSRAGETQSCITASEKGQKLRQESKLREARTLFQICSRPACPKIVRADCAKWAAELNQIAPTVVFGARDASGKDLVDVSVSMDGEELVDSLDGKSVVVDPGMHKFKFETKDGQSVTESVLVKEGEKARAIDVSFGSVMSGGAAGDGTSGNKAPPPKDTPPPKDAGSGGGHTIYPWIVTGVGVAGVGAGLALYFIGKGSIPDNCDPSTRVCKRVGNETNAQLDDDREQAKSGVGQRDLGMYIAIGGGVLAVGGLVWHFLEPSGSSSAAAPPPKEAPKADKKRSKSDDGADKKDDSSDDEDDDDSSDDAKKPKEEARRSFNVSPLFLPGGGGIGASFRF